MDTEKLKMWIKDNMIAVVVGIVVFIGVVIVAVWKRKKSMAIRRRLAKARAAKKRKGKKRR